MSIKSLWNKFLGFFKPKTKKENLLKPLFKMGDFTPNQQKFLRRAPTAHFIPTDEEAVEHLKKMDEDDEVFVASLGMKTPLRFSR